LPARLFAYRHPEAFARLIDILVDASASYLVRQFTAGAVPQELKNLATIPFDGRNDAIEVTMSIAMTSAGGSASDRPV